MKGEPTTDRKIFANDISDKGLVSKIYIFLNSQTLTNSFFFPFGQTFHWKEFTENR